MAGPRLTVPPISALPPSVSLLATARKLGLVEEPSDVHWAMGFVRELEGCGLLETFDPCGESTDFEPPTAEGNRDYNPFGIRAGDQCSAFDYANRQYAARAIQQLARCESYQIASEFWNGTIAQAAGWTDNEYLASETSDDITQAAMDPVDALSCMEMALARCNCGSLGMIHAPANVVTQWAKEGVVRDTDNVLRTVLGTIVVTDGGYSGSAPDGTAPADGSVWIYGTGLIYIRLSPVQSVPDPGDFSAALRRPDNQIAYYAQRVVSVTHEQCCHLAAEVDVPACDYDSGGS